MTLQQIHNSYKYSKFIAILSDALLCDFQSAKLFIGICASCSILCSSSELSGRICQIFTSNMPNGCEKSSHDHHGLYTSLCCATQSIFSISIRFYCVFGLRSFLVNLHWLVFNPKHLNVSQLSTFLTIILWFLLFSYCHLLFYWCYNSNKYIYKEKQ